MRRNYKAGLARTCCLAIVMLATALTASGQAYDNVAVGSGVEPIAHSHGDFDQPGEPPQGLQPLAEIRQVQWCECGEVACGCDLDIPSCGCEGGCNGGCGFEPVCGCGDGCDGNCGASGCSGGCESGGIFDNVDSLHCCCFGDCDLGEPYTLFGHCGNYKMAGWVQMGFHSRANALFNTYPDNYQLQQAWLYFEKELDTSCGFDIGGRIDYVYGTDGQNTQAFGTNPRGWDNPWDNGGQYGSAIPQLYVEAGYGDLSVKAGHFYTIIGHEVVQATGNFFYSHAYTFNNSEPFTHSGVLATYEANPYVTLWGGYSLGWDSAFDDNGDCFLGGASLVLTRDLTVTYASTGGRFFEAWTSGVEKGYMQSIVASYAITDDLQYIFQSDYLDTEDASGNNVRDTYGINQYLLKTISDCWGVGARFEWWSAKNAPAVSRSDVFDLTLGVHYRPHANVLIRPEVRWDWDKDRIAGLQNNASSQTTFGIDTIFEF